VLGDEAMSPHDTKEREAKSKRLARIKEVVGEEAMSPHPTKPVLEFDLR